MIPFEDFWAGWCPNKRVGKKEAREYWELSKDMNDEKRARAVKMAPVYAKQNEYTDTHYILHPVRWLRKERFDDEPPPPPRPNVPDDFR